MIILVLLCYCKYIYSGGRGAMPKFYCGATSAVLLLYLIRLNNSGGRNRSRAAVEPVNTAGAGEGEQPEVYYELSAEKRREVALLCREYA